MIDLAVTAAAADTRLFDPSLLEAAPFSLGPADAELACDAASAIVAGEKGLGREPWRSAYTERVPAKGGVLLLLSRWPIEEDPPAVSVIDGEAVDATTYSVSGRYRHALYRRNGWALAGRSDPLTGDTASPVVTLWYSASYTAGWLMPGQVGPWTAATSYAASTASTSFGDIRGSWVRPSDRRNALRFECTAAGVTDATEPAAFSSVEAGDEIVDGSVTWTAHAAQELPADLEEAALELALHIHRLRQRDQSILRRSAPGASVTYSGEIPVAIAGAVRSYR